MSARPRLTTIGIALAAEALFLVNLARPSVLVFDETHYVPAARTLLSLAGPANIEHPLLGKTIIAAGIALFGDNPVGWRFFSTLAGSAVVAGVYALLWLIFRRQRPALYGALFAATNFTVFVQARIGMLDGFMAAFVVWGLVLLLWAMESEPDQVKRRFVAGSVLLGLAVGVKWAAAPYVAFAGIAILITKAMAGSERRWPGMGAVAALAILGIASIATYFATFAPAFFYADQPMTLAGLIPFQQVMYAQQTQMLAPHPYQSSWWSWPLDIRPIWYLFEPVDGAVRAILLVGNPGVMWGGLMAVAACAWWGVRDRSPQMIGITMLWVASYAVWIIIPKSIGFFYYYYLPSIFLCLPLAAAMDRLDRGRMAMIPIAFTGGAVGLFIHFYPILSAAALASDHAFLRWMWLKSWM